MVASAAATALTSLCVYCKTSMLPQLPGLVQVVQVLNTLLVKQDAASGLLKGVVALLSKAPHNEIQEKIRQICKVQLDPLVQLTKVIF